MYFNAGQIADIQRGRISDYDLDVNLDLDSFRESQYITLYDAVKQGAFARYFSKDEFGMYLVKKLYMGADEPSLA